MTDFDGKAADALKNFTDDVARARELLRKEQSRLKDVEKFIANQRQQLTNLDHQCREAAVRCEALDAQKSKALKQKSLRQTEIVAIEGQTAVVQSARKKLETDTLEAMETTCTVQENFVADSLVAQRKLLDRMAQGNPADLKSEMNQRQQEVSDALLRIQSLETMLAALSSPIASKPALFAAENGHSHCGSGETEALAARLSSLQAQLMEQRTQQEQERQLLFEKLNARKNDLQTLPQLLEEAERKKAVAQEAYHRLIDETSVAFCSKCSNTLTTGLELIDTA